MKKKPIVALIISLMLVLGLATPTAASAPSSTISDEIAEYNQKVTQKAKELEKKYSITIHYPSRANGYAAIGTVTLGMLDSSLEFITPQVIRQMSDFFYYRKGHKISVEYVYPPEGFDTSSGTQLASFASELARLQIYIPRFDGQMTISGNSPVAIVHEMGHAFQDFVEYSHGSGNLRNQWLGYNDGYQYDSYRKLSPSATTFASDYASTDYHEDFAETFAQAFTANRDGLGIAERLSINGERTGLGKKISIVEALLPMYMTDVDQAVLNIKKIYTTASFTNFGSVRLSGNSLEYIGFPEPNGIITGVLHAMDVRADTCKWRKEIGGWYIVSDMGHTYLAFPGAQFTRLPASVEAAG